MAQMIKSVLRNRVTIALSAIDDTQLPPNPLSFLVLTIRYNTLAANDVPTLAQLLAVLTSIDVLHRGTSVVSIDLDDLYAMNVALLPHGPFPFRLDDPVTSSGFLNLLIPFGRRLYDPEECFPCTRAGELILRLTRAASDAGISAPTFTVSSVELPEADPKRFVRYTTLNFVPGVVGDNDLQLYPSTVYLGLLVFSTTVPTGAGFVTTVDRMKLLLNNIEYDVSQTNWEDAWAEWSNRGGAQVVTLGHTHRENTAAAYVQNAETEGMLIDVHPLRQFAFLDFDPTGDMMYSIDARNIARVVLRITAGDTSPVRVVPLEVIFLMAA